MVIQINVLLRVIESECLAALALQQPVAADLRDIVAVCRLPRNSNASPIMRRTLPKSCWEWTGRLSGLWTASPA